MAAKADTIAIRFSRREVALLFEAAEAMALPGDPDDARLLLELRDPLGKLAAGEGAAR